MATRSCQAGFSSPKRLAVASGGGVACCCAWLIYESRHRCPQIVHSPDSKVAPFAIKCGSLEGFAPAWWLPGGYLQTLCCHLRMNVYPVSYRYKREILLGSDGGRFSVDYDVTNEQLPPDAPILMFLPTLTGCSRQAYGFASICRREGLRCVTVNRRGHVQTLATPQFSIAGSVPDLKQAIERCQSHYPGAKIGLVGASMGSALLIRYLGDEADQLPASIVGAVGLCFGFEAGVALARVRPAFAFPLVNKLKRYFLYENREVLESADSAAFRRCAEAEDVHAFCVAHAPFAGKGLSGPSAGSSCHDFHRRTNPMDVIESVRIPTLIINAADDPIAVARNVADHVDVFLSHPFLALVLSPVGGHLGFLFQGEDGNLESWAESVSVRFIQEVLAARVEDRTTNTNIDTQQIRT